jgi:hypothetical protein
LVFRPLPLSVLSRCIATLLGEHRITGDTLPKKIDCGQEEFGRNA